MQGAARILKDSATVFGGDRALLGDSVGQPLGKILLSLAIGGQADLSARDQVDALGLQGAVVDANVEARFGQMLIRDFGPPDSPVQ